MSDKPIIELVNVSKIFDHDSSLVNALKKIDIKIGLGEFVGILGPSGSGKSTFLHLAGALDLPSEGNIFFQGESTSSMTRDELAKMRQKIGFVFQNLNLVPRFTALQNIELAMAIQGQHNRKTRTLRALEMLKTVGLQDRAKHKNNELSGGQQQRVAIARALAQDPVLLLLDEPTGNVDTKTRDELLDLIGNIHTNHQLTTIIVTHDHEIVSRCSRILHLVDGKFVSDEISEAS
ncbi:MAG: ABC transporter ATP-binding protein [Candidatus Heimdallarchaeota archaeon]|nr:ABC transporter ATP-binding protein [Candidatus Heimdallarchaeota archaeon]